MNLPNVDGGFRTILADPPWPYEASAVPRDAITNQYETMSIEEIVAMPVESVAAKDCVLLLWATNPKLPEAFQVMKSWGFNYRTMRTWVKDRMGTGHWLRGQTEHILIGKRGNPRVPFNPAPSVFFGRWGGHSVKPREQYLWAEATGLAPRLELFARLRRHGWASWGNQLSKTIETPLVVSEGHPSER